MTVRRLASLLAASAALLLTMPAGVASAAGTGVIASPAAGATLTGPTGLVVEVTGRAGGVLDPRPHTVRVRLADPTGGSQMADSQVVDLGCEQRCNDTSTWTGPAVDPATLAPFRSGPSCNGGYVLQASVDGGAWAGHVVRVAMPPAAPTGVAVAPGTASATVSWDASTTPDVTGYRVQRQVGGGAWSVVGQAGPDARSLADDDAPSGQVAYRVLALRGDGLVDATTAAPCADPGTDLSTASGPMTTSVRAPAVADDEPSGPPTPARPSPTPAPTTTGGAGGDGDGGNGRDGGDATGTDGPDEGSGGSDDAPADEGPADDGAEPVRAAGGPTDGATAAGAPRPSGPRVASSSPLRLLDLPELDVPPALQEPLVADATGADPGDEPEESFYGDGMAFEEELDFGDLGTVEAVGAPPGPTTRTVRVPGALQTVLGEELDLHRVLGPVAAGLVVLALALHLRRWTREGLRA